MKLTVRREKTVFPGLALVVLSTLFAPVARATTVVVGTCKTGVHFATIGAAIAAVPSGSTIDICAGTYPEQLAINKSLTLTGLADGTADEPVLVAPSGGLVVNASDIFNNSSPIEAQVWVSGPGITVNINTLSVDGLNNGVSGCSPEVMGILYQNASGTLNHVTTRNQFLGPEGGSLSGCQAGEGIFVETDTATNLVTVENSSVHDFQKNGITGIGTGLTLNVTSSYIVGQGATTGAAENGIQLGPWATGTLNENFVIDEVWAPDTITDTGDAASGILLYDAGENNAVVKSNTVGNTQFGIVVVTDTPGEGDGAMVNSNKVFGTKIFDAIDLCTNNNTVKSNTIVNSAESAIHMDATCGSTGNNNTVSSNTIIDACVGILEDAGTTNALGTNSFFDAGTTIGSSCPTGDTDVLRRSSKSTGVKHSGGSFRPVR